VLVAGGISNDYDYYEFPEPQKAEIYDPATNTWREVGTPLLAYLHTATLLANGNVLITGGIGGFEDIRVGPAKLFDTTSET
jgi:hypothetical protein